VLVGFGIRTKITFCFLIFVIIMSSVFALTSYHRIIEAMNMEIEKHGSEFVKILSQTTAPYIFDSDYVTILDMVNKVIENSEIQVLSIIDAKGGTWLTTNPELNAVKSDDLFYTSIIQDRELRYRQITRNGRKGIEFVSPISALGKVVYLLKIEMSLERLEQQAEQRIKDNLIICGVMILLAALLAVLLAKVLTDPIKILVRGTRELSKGNLAHRISVKAGDETGLLSQSFNMMADTLEKELSERRLAESRLQDHSNMLEDIVAERTALLTESNLKLSEEIEQHRKTESALIESKERYGRFSEVTLDGIVFHDETGIIDVNSSCSKMFGYSLEAMIGRNLLETICHPEHIESARETLSTQQQKYFEITCRRNNGEIVPVELQSRSLQSDGKALTVTSLRDITERKKLEAQLYQAEKMEGIGRLAAGIAHDLNNILSGLVTLPELLLLDLPDGDPLKDPIKAIQKSGENAAVIVQDMLTLGNSGLNIVRTIDPVLMVMDYITSPESMRLKNTHPGVKIKLDLEKNVSNIKGSAVHLAKLLMNLVYNAADAIENEGLIVLAVENVYIDKPFGCYETVAEGTYVHFTVSDSGTGISQQDIPMIFEPFYTKKVLGRSGTGLGMAIVWNTVKDHKGYIDIDSEVGVGTRIHLYIPATEDAAEQVGMEQNLAALRGNQETVLVVDDVEEQRKIACTILERLNYRVNVVSGGLEAIESLQQQPADLILLDMIMEPGINGLETCKRIFTMSPQASVLLASGYAESHIVTEALSLGARKYLKKPYSIAMLGAAVRDTLSEG
jgi:PAS domain S-box-containing protein